MYEMVSHFDWLTKFKLTKKGFKIEIGIFPLAISTSIRLIKNYLSVSMNYTFVSKGVIYTCIPIISYNFGTLYFLYVLIQDKYEDNGDVYGQKMRAYEHAAKIVKVGESTVRKWVQEFELMEFIVKSKRGAHAKTWCPILEDPEFREKFIQHVRQTSRIQGKY